MKLSLGILFISSLIAVVHCDLEDLGKAAKEAREAHLAAVATARNMEKLGSDQYNRGVQLMTETGRKWDEADSAYKEAKRIAEQRAYNQY